MITNSFMNFETILDTEFTWCAYKYLFEEDYVGDISIMCDRFYLFPDGSCAFEWAGQWSIDIPGNFDPERRKAILSKY